VTFRDGITDDKFTDIWEIYHNAPCKNGMAKDRVSGSILNHKVMIKVNPDGSVHYVPSLGGTLNAGYVFNHTAVFGWLGKCTFIWDGASNNRYNYGCGGVNLGLGSCDNKCSAYYNVCPVNGQCNPDAGQCKPDDAAVLRDWVGHRTEAGCPTTTEGNACYFKGPSFDGPVWDYPNGPPERNWWTNVNVNADETRRMLEVRIERQKLEGPSHNDRTAQWNEIVLDGAMLAEELERDPAALVPAVFWHSGGRSKAEKFAADFCKRFNVEPCIPILHFDVGCDVRGANCPFVV
jgi:hypothetical protein